MVSRETDNDARAIRINDMIRRIDDLLECMDRQWDNDPWLPGSPVGEHLYWEAMTSLKHLKEDVLLDRLAECEEHPSVDDKRLDDERRYAEYRQDRNTYRDW